MPVKGDQENATAMGGEQDLATSLSEYYYGKTAKEILLTGKQLSDSNTVEREMIQPQETEISLENGSYQIPPFAFSVLRIPMEHDSLFTESPYL